MRKRKLMTAIATAALLLGTSYTVMADGSASSSYSTHAGSANSAGGSTASFGGNGNQSAASTGTGGAAAGTETGGVAGGAAVSAGRLGGGSISGAGAGGSGHAFAVGGEKHPKPPKPGKTVIGGGGASPLSCNVTVSDFWKWRKLDLHQRQLTLNCQCLTEDHVLTSTADKDCPMNATEIFTAVRN